MMSQELTIVFEHESTDPEGAWQLIARHLIDVNLSEDTYKSADQTVAFELVSKHLIRRGRKHFGIYGRRFSFGLTPIGEFSLDILRVSCVDTTDWDKWVRLLRNAGRFIHAFAVDAEFDFWQNAKDPIEFEAKGRRFEHLPTVSNGLPFPLEQMVIDTSANPGRQVFRNGFIEAVAAQMWMGDRFWEATGSCKEALRSGGYEIAEIDGLLRVYLGSMFTESTNRQTLDSLRRILFK
jgi:hypothetical protein